MTVVLVLKTLSLPNVNVLSHVAFILISFLLCRSQSHAHADLSTEVFDENVIHKNFGTYSSTKSQDGGGVEISKQNISPLFISVPVPVAAFWKFWLQNYANYPHPVLTEQRQDEPPKNIHQYKLEYKKPKKPAHTKQNYGILIRANANDNDNQNVKEPNRTPKNEENDELDKIIHQALTIAEKAAIQQVLNDYSQNEIVNFLKNENSKSNIHKSHEKDSRRKRRSPPKKTDEEMKAALNKINEICSYQLSMNISVPKTEEKKDNDIETIDGVEYAVFQGVYHEDPDIDFYKIAAVDPDKNVEIPKPKGTVKPKTKGRRRRKRTAALLSKHLRKSANHKIRRRRSADLGLEKGFKMDLKQICRAATPTTVEDKTAVDDKIETIDGVDFAVFNGVYHEDPDLEYYKIGLFDTESTKPKKEKNSKPEASKVPEPGPPKQPEGASKEPETTKKPETVKEPEPVKEPEAEKTAPVETTTPKSEVTTSIPEATAQETTAEPHEIEKTGGTTEHADAEEATEIPQTEGLEKNGKAAQQQANTVTDESETKKSGTPKPKGFAALFACPGPRCREPKTTKKPEVQEKEEESGEKEDDEKKGRAAAEATTKKPKQGKTTASPILPANNKLPLLPHGATHKSKIYSLHEEDLHYDDIRDDKPKVVKKKPTKPEKPKKTLLNPFAKFG